MSDAWGGSWGDAWGDSWGGTQASPSHAGGRRKRKKRRIASIDPVENNAPRIATEIALVEPSVRNSNNEDDDLIMLALAKVLH